jgi:hypothetical protein
MGADLRCQSAARAGARLLQLPDLDQELAARAAQLASVLLEALQNDHVALTENVFAYSSRIAAAGAIALLAQFILRKAWRGNDRCGQQHEGSGREIPSAG